MRSVLIWLIDVLIQVVLLYAAFRLCQKLLARAFGNAFGYRECDVIVTWSALSLGPSLRQHSLPEKVSDTR